MKKIHFLLLLLLCLSTKISLAQNTGSTLESVQNMPDKYYASINKKMRLANENLSKKTIKFLAKFQKQEAKLQRELQKLNTEVAVDKADRKYKELSEMIKVKANPIHNFSGGEYNSYLDTLRTSLSFLKQSKDVAQNVEESLNHVNELQNKFLQTEKINAFISERKVHLKETLSKYAQLPVGLRNEFKKFRKTAYYYSAQIQQIKETVKDPKKIERKAIATLNNLPVFQKFMKENSQLASIFRMPGGTTGVAQGLAGLQTRASVQGMIQDRIAAGGPNAMAQVQQNLSAAHAEMNKLKDKINQFTNGGGVPDMPEFKPNEQKTKSFLKRLEYSADVQFEKSSSLFPSTANIGLGLGYKLNDKSTIGIGASYKAGMGTLQHISITHQGAGLRSFMDWKAPLKGRMFATLWISGGYEMNYSSAFKDIEQLKDYSAWQRSALIGISKKYKVSKKVKGEMKLLYDFLHRDHVPVSKAVVFRMGYKF